ncbi:hypothetical protein K2X14_14460 [Acetobacter sp. TBRC 12305]|uniref:Uncharacterized protein n=1 Tax=Acetobacter garciniae TaxID=2817435 RepID=A0A939HR44_9PROT|nr:hypothetical protein [Acetobacter garciniae]MBO1326224.1 hypothetical protein [Acetobacter garciniae]MBX0346038.1 hypothetical protein [Acetobacter garciniae]
MGIEDRDYYREEARARLRRAARWRPRRKETGPLLWPQVVGFLVLLGLIALLR